VHATTAIDPLAVADRDFIVVLDDIFTPALTFPAFSPLLPPQISVRLLPIAVPTKRSLTLLIFLLRALVLAVIPQSTPALALFADRLLTLTLFAQLLLALLVRFNGPLPVPFATNSHLTLTLFMQRLALLVLLALLPPAFPVRSFGSTFLLGLFSLIALLGALLLSELLIIGIGLGDLEGVFGQTLIRSGSRRTYDKSRNHESAEKKKKFVYHIKITHPDAAYRSVLNS
jgi:hypothetical protein